MNSDSFTDAAMVVMGHGSTVHDDSGATVFQHAAELRKRNLFAEVREAFWKQQPRVQDVLASLAHPRLFVMPFFISEGYFSDEVIPKALGFRLEGQREFSRILRLGSKVVIYCKPVGTHESMTNVLLARARGVVIEFPFPRAPAPDETTLFIAGHGTERNENSRAAIDQHVARIRAENIYAAVHGVFLEQEPRIKDIGKLAQSRNVIVVPFFMSDGMHTEEDIPLLLGASKRLLRQRLQASQPPWRNPTEVDNKLIWYSKSAGSDPRVAEVILDRAKEAAGWH